MLCNIYLHRINRDEGRGKDGKGRRAGEGGGSGEIGGRWKGRQSEERGGL